MPVSLKCIIQSMRLKSNVDQRYIRYQLRILHTALGFRKDIDPHNPDWPIDTMLQTMFGDTSTGIKIFDGPIWYGQQRHTNHLILLSDSNIYSDPEPLNQWIRLCNDVGITMNGFERRYIPMYKQSKPILLDGNDIHVNGRLVFTNGNGKHPTFTKGIIRGIRVHDHLRL